MDHIQERKFLKSAAAVLVLSVSVLLISISFTVFVSVLLLAIIGAAAWGVFLYNGIVSRKHFNDETFRELIGELRTHADTASKIAETLGTIRGRTLEEEHAAESFGKAAMFLSSALHEAANDQCKNNFTELASSLDRLAAASAGLTLYLTDSPAMRDHITVLNQIDRFRAEESAEKKKITTFNLQAADYNAAISTFPSSLIAKHFSLAVKIPMIDCSGEVHGG